MKIIPIYMKPCCDLTDSIFSSTFPIFVQLGQSKKYKVGFYLFQLFSFQVHLLDHNQLSVVLLHFPPLYSPVFVWLAITSQPTMKLTDSEQPEKLHSSFLQIWTINRIVQFLFKNEVSQELLCCTRQSLPVPCL